MCKIGVSAGKIFFKTKKQVPVFLIEKPIDLVFGMEKYTLGNTASPVILIQPVDDHDLALLESQVKAIKRLAYTHFCLLAVKVNNWNTDLSPWQAPAVFGKADFGDGALQTLHEIVDLCRAADKGKTFHIGGYSLAGLFALWAAYQTDLFAGVAAASPSIWFPGFTDYMRSHTIKSKAVYLSLGDSEEKTRNPAMSKVGDCIRESHEILNSQGIQCTLEWNKGNHFMNPDRRTAKAFAWVMKQ